MSNRSSVSFLINQLEEGDADAAQRLWDRYYHRLIGLAQKKLQDGSRSAQDAEDVVQSAFSSFCQRVQAGLCRHVDDRDNLWSLLALITARKAANQRKHERRAKRGGGRVRNEAACGDGDLAAFEQLASEDPLAESSVSFFDELEVFMEALDDPSERLILLWKLEERTNPEIARHLDCSLSSVERKLRLIRQRLQEDAGSLAAE